MKKFLNISLLTFVALASLSLGSCSNEMDDIFDEDAVIRLENAKTEYFDILTRDGGKWKLEYFSNTGEPGYTYILSFKKDGMVTMSGHNKWINYIKNNSLNASAFGSEDSMWELIFDNSLVLSFNTYNKYFHLFASPDKVPTGGAGGDGIANTEGYGHEGDYEFNIMKYSGDTIYLTGKKYNLPMVMTRLSTSIDDETYLNEVNVMNKTLFSGTIPYVFIILPNGQRWIAESASSCNMRLYREGDDKISSSEYHNTIITHDGMAFMNPVTLDGYTIQWFKKQADGTLLCVEDNQTLIVADALENNLFNSKDALKWKCDFDVTKSTDMSGRFLDLVKEVNQQLPSVPGEKSGSKLKEAVITYNSDLSTYVLNMKVRRSASVSPEAHFYFTPTIVSTSQVKMSFAGGNDYANRLLQNSTKVAEFIEFIGSNNFNLSSASMLAPVAITMAQDGHAENYLVWNLQ